MTGADHDRVWGHGNWTYCECSREDTGQRCAHSTKYHAGLIEEKK
jgi:hypothetical protein